MIVCQNIFKSYEKLQVLKGVSLEISKGDLVCIVGPSGAGKSTLLQILGTLDRPSSGLVKFNGEDVPGSPFHCVVLDASRVTASGDGLEKVPVGRPATFYIHSQVNFLTDVTNLNGNIKFSIY